METRTPPWLIWAGTICVMAATTALALYTPLHQALFPELAALAFGLLSHPEGPWGEQDWAVAVTPAATGILGILVNRLLGYSPATVALTVAGGFLLLSAMRSAVTPALSAGLLPVVLNVTSWLYPVAILIGSLLVVAVHRGHIRYRRRNSRAPGGNHAGAHRWPAAALVTLFAAGVSLLTQATGLRFLLFPPLVVLAYEMLANPSCPWAGRPLAGPVGALLTSSLGLALRMLLGVSVVGVVLAVAAGLTVLMLLRLYMPPALAVGALPFIIGHPSWAYPLSVAMGTILAVLLHAAWCKVMTPSPKSWPIGRRM